MNASLRGLFGIAILNCAICAPSFGQGGPGSEPDVDVVIEIAHRKDGKERGSVSHPRSVKQLKADPLVQTVTGLDKRSSVVTLSYVGYVNFKVAKNTEGEQLTSGHVIAVQVFTGKEGVTAKTAEKSVTKLVVYNQLSQTLYQDDHVAVEMRKKE